MSSNAASKARNKRLAIVLTGVFALMVGAAYASVPLYRLFCQVTGFGGTTMKAQKASDVVLEQKVTVRFDANVRKLPWTFTAEQTSQEVKIGETGLAFFKVVNNSDKPVTGRAMYNVVPEVAGAYFSKLECFCFNDQTLQPGQTMEFPVVYFIDPRYAEDIDTKGKGEVTLSYTFYPSTEGAKTATAQTVKAASGES